MVDTSCTRFFNLDFDKVFKLKLNQRTIRTTTGDRTGDYLITARTSHSYNQHDNELVGYETAKGEEWWSGRDFSRVETASRLRPSNKVSI
ncbi:hypothetical protein J6590_033983 [Homalodisca vitripennis]|nr:hypothetical protein J6590_033983 [Homalodisca vitripennis]